jgi:hypothetical protein
MNPEETTRKISVNKKNSSQEDPQDFQKNMCTMVATAIAAATAAQGVNREFAPYAYDDRRGAKRSWSDRSTGPGSVSSPPSSSALGTPQRVDFPTISDFLKHLDDTDQDGQDFCSLTWHLSDNSELGYKRICDLVDAGARVADPGVWLKEKLEGRGKFVSEGTSAIVYSEMKCKVDKIRNVKRTRRHCELIFSHSNLVY